MAQYDEEMKKRREKREAQRQKQRAQARRLKRRLFLAALVLVLCAVGIVILIQNAESGDTASAAATEETAAQTEKAVSSLQSEPTTTIHIRAAGDLNITDTVVESGLSATGYDYSVVFKDVAAALSEADLTLLNLEGNICGEPYGTDTTSAPAELLQALRSAGVDLIQMANSCSLNNGINGLTSTLQAIRSAGMEPVGAFASSAEYQSSKGYTVAEVQGIKIVFVAFTKGLGGRGLPTGSEDLVNLLYTDYATTYQSIDRDYITTVMKNVKAESPDLVVALLHWGSEYNDDISSTQSSIVSLLQKNGVDVIIGTHPHLVQAIDYDQSAGTLVAYSLGDFFGDAERSGTNYSIILDLEITKDNTSGTTKVTDYSYIPIYTVKKTESAGDYSYSRVMRIETALEAYEGNYLDKITATCKENMEYALTRIEARLVMTEDD